MTALTPEEVDEIRAAVEDYDEPLDDVVHQDRAALLAHVDHLTAENARLRERLDAVRDYAEYRHLYSGICRDILDLLNPTEGGTDDH